MCKRFMKNVFRSNRSNFCSCHMAGGLTQPTEIKKLNFSRLNQKLGDQIREEKDMLLRRPAVRATDQDFRLLCCT